MAIVVRRAFAPLLLLSLAASSLAQIPGLAGVPNVEYNPLLVINPKVQKELGLPPAKATQLQKAFFEEAMAILPTLTRSPGKAPLSQAERARRTMAGVTHMESRLAGMLTPPQRVRLRQLTLQSIGASAALQPKVAAQLGLTAGQRTRLVSAVGDANEAVAARLNRGVSGQDLQHRMPEMTRLQNNAKLQGDRALMTILTPAQRTKWRAMLGRPLDLSGFLGVGSMGIGG